MKIITVTLSFILLSPICSAQIKTYKKNGIAISIPLILNNSNGVYYSLGNKQKPSGTKFSHGVSLNYSMQLYKNWFGSIGVGYFKQSFNISRPFEFDGDTVTNLLYSTKMYNYHCFVYNGGLGYSYSLNNKIKINGQASFNLFSSFRQNYTPIRYSGSEHKNTQTNTLNMQIGYMINISAGLEYFITNKTSVGADLLVPFITKWNDDEVFTKSFFGTDSQIIAENRFSVGTALSFKYHF